MSIYYIFLDVNICVFGECLSTVFSVLSFLICLYGVLFGLFLYIVKATL